MNLRPGQMIALGAAAVVVIFSFFAFMKVDSFNGTDIDDVRDYCKDKDQLDDSTKKLCDFIGDGKFSVWKTDFRFPLSTWPAVLAGVVLVLGGLAATGKSLPDQILGFSPGQLMAGLSVSAALMMVFHLIGGTEDEMSWGIGFWFMLLGSVGMAVGTMMELQAEGGGGGGHSATGPSPF
jgi:hypothetical protein